MTAISAQKQNHPSQIEVLTEEMKILHNVSKSKEEKSKKEKEEISAFTEQIVQHALKERTNQEIQDTFIGMMLSTFLDKTIACLSAKNILPDSIKEETSKILDSEVTKNLYESARKIYSEGMKELVLSNNVKLLLDNPCLKKAFIGALSDHGRVVLASKMQRQRWKTYVQSWIF